MITSRRNFIKEFILGITGFSFIGEVLENTLVKHNPDSRVSESKIYYSVPVKSSNPCCEIALCGDKREAEKFASYNHGIVNYSGIINGKRVEGSYRV